VKVTELKLPGVKLIKPRVFRDARGFFLETYSAPRYAAFGIGASFVQDNHSRSAEGTLRGLHYQSTPGQAKLVRVSVGRIYDVAVDIRADSPSFGQWLAAELDAEEHTQLFVPVGYAHGFCVLSEWAEVLYKVSSPYDPSTECSIRWNDAELAVKWPISAPLLSERDQRAPSFADYRKQVGR
jgi:dTDP-4-dehydrorhamnose 3,5-epimerase